MARIEQALLPVRNKDRHAAATSDALPNNGNSTLSDPMSDLVRHYDFPFPDAFLDL
jgi:hypothetical protein